jgi:CBS domain-containing protein
MLQRNAEKFGQVLKGKLLLFLVKIVGYIWNSLGELAMKVSDILRVKGNILITVRPDETLATAVQVMSEKDLGSLVVMDRGNLVGMLTFREVMKSLAENNGSIGAVLVGSAMDKEPLTCTSETDMDDVRRMMLTHHARYMPVIENRVLMGVISFYDVAKAVVDSQNFENKMLKAYIRDWPDGDNKQEKEAPSL